MLLLLCIPINKMGSLRSYPESWMVCTINCLLVLAELKESMEKGTKNKSCIQCGYVASHSGLMGSDKNLTTRSICLF